MLSQEEVNKILSKPIQELTYSDFDGVKQSYEEAKLCYEVEASKEKALYLNNNTMVINADTIPNSKAGKSHTAYNRFKTFKELLEYVKKAQILADTN